MNHLEARQQEIAYAKSTGLMLDVEILGGNRCKEALELNGTIHSFKSILESNLLPYDKCTRTGGCNCIYLFKTFRDETGRAIKKEY